MRVYLGSDHAGFKMKEALKEYFEGRDLDLVDVGASSEDSVDYPDYAERVARAVATGEADRGVLVCGSGIGMAMAANKVPGVRAAMVTDPELARMMRLHNDANILVLGGRILGKDLAKEIVRTWVTTPFEGQRHCTRLDKITGIETFGQNLVE